MIENEIAIVASADDIDIEQLQMLKDELDAQKEMALKSFSGAIAKYRDDAIEGRKASGIEDIWDEDEDAYAGYDDANRSEEKTESRLDKSRLENSYRANPKRSQVKSTVFVNITRPYVDAAAARIGDMLVPTDEPNWAMSSTPVPEQFEAALQGQLGPDFKQQAEAAKAAMDKELDNAETQIEDWLIETNYNEEVREVIEDCTRVGVGIIKGPFAVRRKTLNGDEIKPASKRVDYNNFFPDPNCGANIQNGKYVFERDLLTAKKVMELANNPRYMSDQIEKVLQEGPGKRLLEDTEIPLQMDELYEVWYFHGNISAEDMEICECNEIDGENTDQIPAIVTMINDTVIHVAQMPGDYHDFPYDVICWQKRKDYWAGIGVARQIRTPQRMLNAASRAMMDNAGISAGPQIVYRKGVIEPADGNWELTPNKRWIAHDDADMQSVANAFMAINLPSMQPQLNEIIQFAIRMAEDVTGLPMLLQGSQGQAPDTVGGMTLLNNNANTVLRRIARMFDSDITIPHIRRYYLWLLTYYDTRTDLQIEPRGSSTLVERDIQNQAILQMGQMVLNPAFGVKPDQWMREYLKSLKFDPKRFMPDEGEEGGQAQPGPEVQQMMAQMEQMNQQMQQMQQELSLKTQQHQAEMQYKYAELEQEKQLAMLKVQAEKDLKLSLEAFKAQKDQTDKAQDIRLKALEGKVKSFDAETKRMSVENNIRELNYKSSTGNQGI